MDSHVAVSGCLALSGPWTLQVVDGRMTLKLDRTAIPRALTSQLEMGIIGYQSNKEFIFGTC